MKVIFKTTTETKFNTKGVLPIVGEIEFDSEGKFTAEVSEEEKDLLINAVPDIEVISVEESDQINELTDNLNKVEDLLELENDPGTGVELDEVIGSDVLKNESLEGDQTKTVNADQIDALLDGKNLPDLKQLAKESGFPEEEWLKLNKAPLIEYLKGKLVKA